MKQLWELHGQQRSIREIARILAISRNTVRKYLRAPGLPAMKPRPPGASKLDPFWDHVRARLAAGVENCARAAATALIVGPLGVLLGMPLPAGLRHVDSFRLELKPWAWDINTCATVVGASFCMVLVTTYGFSSALLVAGLAYAVGYLGLRANAARSASVASRATQPADLA